MAAAFVADLRSKESLLVGIPCVFAEMRPQQLSEDAIHVCRLRFAAHEAQRAQFESVLADDERARAARYRFEKDRVQYLLTRGALRWLLGAYAGLPPESLRFQYNAKGKPSLDPAHGSDIEFNVAHSQGLALLAFAKRRRVGIDVEFLSRPLEFEELAERFFSAAEVQALRALPNELRRNAFFACWTRKEAYLKARGAGLSLALNQFDVSLSPNEPPALLRVQDDEDEVRRWFIADINPSNEHAAALAAETPQVPVRCYEFVAPLNPASPLRSMEQDLP